MFGRKVIYVRCINCSYNNVAKGILARGLRAKIWPDCAILDTSMKFGTVVDHD